MKQQRRQPMKHQEQVLAWASTRDSVALFLEMRLGKTLIAVRWAQLHKGPYLVVCPLSVVYTWIEELLLEGIHGVPLVGTTTQKQNTFWEEGELGAEWFVTNYETLYVPNSKRKQAEPSWLAELLWPVVILDESAKLRNPQTKTSQICCRYLAQAKHKAILSGLPNPESSLDFFQQMKFLHGQFLGRTSFWKFRSELYQIGRYKWHPRFGTNKAIRKAVQEQAYVLSRKSVHLDNPRVRSTRHVFLPADIQRQYDDLEEDFALGELKTKWSAVKFGWLHQLAGGCPKNPEIPSHSRKLDELAELLAGDLRDQHVIVWHTLNSEGDAAAMVARRIGRSTRIIRGEVPVDERQEYIRLFRAGHVNTLVIQVSCGMYGLDLSAASAAIYFSEPTSHDQYAQSMDRIVHPTKKIPILIVSLVAKDTVDEDVHNALTGKRLSSSAMLKQVWKGIKKRRSKKKHDE